MPEEERGSLSGLTKYWQVVVGILLAALSIGNYLERQKNQEVEITNLKASFNERLKNLEARQERKWGDLEEIEQRVDDLEEHEAYQKGKEDALNQKK